MITEFDITLTSKDMYRFSMHHAYTRGQGIVSVIIALLCFFVAVKTHGSVEAMYTVLYAVFGVLFLFYIPVNLYLRTKRQFLLSEVLQNALHYRVDEGGIHTSQNGESADLMWDQVYKMVSTRHNVLVYSSRVNAFVIPRDQIAEKYEVLRQVAKEHLADHRFKMK